MSLPRQPRHESTTLSTLSTLTTRTASTDDLALDAAAPHDDRHEPWLFRLLSRAAAFGEVIDQHPSSPAGDKENLDHDGNADVVGLLGHDLASMAKEYPPPVRPATKDSAQACWKYGAPDRWVNMTVSSWRAQCRHSGGLAGSSGSESDEEERRSSEEIASVGGEKPALMLEDGDKFSAEPEPITPPTPLTDISEAPSLTAEDKVALIVSEFGALADGEEETLLTETDASFFQDVAILGVLHLTTHRIAFHASLLSARPDLAPAQQILHSGPAVVRKGTGLRKRKRRVWLELTHDMITSFRGSEDDQRVRPLRTVLLSAFRKIYPLDHRRPRFVRIEFSTSTSTSTPHTAPHAKSSPHRSLSRPWSGSTGSGRKKRTGDAGVDDADAHEDGDQEGERVVAETVEFDTEEAAMEWRKEVQAALYLFRHRRQNVLRPSTDADTEEGVRISIPLVNILEQKTHVWANLGKVIQLDVGPQASQPRTSDDTSTGHFSKYFRSESLDSGLDTQQPAPTSIKFQFALLQSDATWDGLSELIARAGVRWVAEGDARHGLRPVVDFGGTTFVETGLGGIGDQKLGDGDGAGVGEGAGVGDVVRGSREREVRKAFGLFDDLEIWVTKCRLHRAICTSGLLVVSARFICFWSRFLAASDIKFRFHTEDVRDAVPEARTWCPGSGLTLQIRGHHDMLFEFSHKTVRDDAAGRINALRLKETQSAPSITAAATNTHSSISSPTPTSLLSPPSRTLSLLHLRTFPPSTLAHISKPINVPPNIPYGISPRRFVLLTIGSRGDVQPYIALGKGLQAAGHGVTILTHGEYKSWIEGWGIAHRDVGGDPGALMKLSVEHKMFSPQFFKESIAHFRTWIDELLVDAWEHCKDADVLIESPSAMAGVHIAEALNIPYFRAFTMPWSKTVQYPHPFISPPVEGSGRFNTASYVLFDNVFWLGTSGQINKWRKKHLGLPATDMGHLAQAKIPFLYNFSPTVVPKPLDWGDQIAVTGYWFLDNPDLDWKPSDGLLQFIARARTDGKPLVYIGFGSITVPHARAMSRSIVKGVLKSDVRAILSKGWSSRMEKQEGPDVVFPAEIFAIDKAPHDWLFPQIDAALHHGGAGTTGASLRAGIPTLIKPWFGDQFFWASRVQRLGAGLRVGSLRSGDLAEALRKATGDRIMQEKAASVGERIRQEDGVPKAIKAIYTYLDRAGKDRMTLEN